MTEDAGALAPVTFLRLDRAELQDGNLVIRAVDSGVRAHHRLGPQAPLAYLYEQADSEEPEADLVLAAGHYDQSELVWSFSGEVSGIIGLTEPMSSAGDTRPIEGRLSS